MLLPSTRYPRPSAWGDLRQRVAVRSFDEMARAIADHMSSSARSGEDLEEDVVVQAVQLLVDTLYVSGRPDLADAMEDLYYGALAERRRD